MVASINSNVSALGAFTKQIAVSANNVANIQSDEFKKSRAINSEGPNNNTVETNIQRIDTPGPLVEDEFSTAETIEFKELSNTDLAEELTNQIIAQRGFEANAKTIKTYEETVGSLIDMIG